MTDSNSFEPKIAVVGCGRVGLPLCLMLVEKGFDVQGIDIDAGLRTKVNDERVMPFHEPGFEKTLAAGALTIFPSLADALGRNTYIITVGSPLGDHLEADVGPLMKVVSRLALQLKVGDLVIFRSTLAPGLGSYFRSYLESESGLDAGDSFLFAYCPERLVEGAAKHELQTLAQIIGADDPCSAAAAAALFEKMGIRCHLTSLREAEVVKLFCNTSRYLEFAISNALFVMADALGCDPHRIAQIANDGYTRPIAARPGFTAGTCLRKDFGLLVEGRTQGQFLISAWQLHESMPWHLIEAASHRLGGLRNKCIGVLGLSFKKDTDDIRDSLALKLIRLLLRQSVSRLLVHDPFVSGTADLDHPNLEVCGDPALLFGECDVVFIATNHSQYATEAKQYLANAERHGTLVVDMWNVLKTGTAYIQSRKPAREGATIAVETVT